MKFIFYIPNISIAEWIGLVISFFGTIATCIIAGYNIFFQKNIKRDEKKYRNEKFVEAIRMIAVKTDVAYQNLQQKIEHVFIKAFHSKDPVALLNDEDIAKLDTQISDLKNQLSIEHKMLLSYMKENRDFHLISMLERLLFFMEDITYHFKGIMKNIYYLNKSELNLERFIKLANSNNEYPSINTNNIDRPTILKMIYEKLDEYYNPKNKTIDSLKLIYSLSWFNDKVFDFLDKKYHDLYSDKQIYKELDRIIEEI